MKKLLSLPPNLTRPYAEGKRLFHHITGLNPDEYFCTNDPVGHKLGSGGGTTWLLMEAFRNDKLRTTNGKAADNSESVIQDSEFSRWLSGLAVVAAAIV